MNGYVYKPRASAYSRAHSVLLQACQAAGRPLSKQEAERRLKVTPGMMFADGVTLDEVFETLQVWRLIRVDGDRIEALTW